MTTRELRQYFKDHLVPTRLYHLRGAHHNRICMEQVADGWNIYYAERHNKVGLLHFATESEACEAMREQIGKVMQALYGLQFASCDFIV